MPVKNGVTFKMKPQTIIAIIVLVGGIVASFFGNIIAAERFVVARTEAAKQEMQDQMQVSNKQTRQDIKDFREEMKQDVREFRNEMKGDMRSLAEQIRTFVDVRRGEG